MNGHTGYGGPEWFPFFFFFARFFFSLGFFFLSALYDPGAMDRTRIGGVKKNHDVTVDVAS